MSFKDTIETYGWDMTEVPDVSASSQTRYYQPEQLRELKKRMPEVLAHYGITSTRGRFALPWAEPGKRNGKLFADTNLVFDLTDQPMKGKGMDVFAFVGKAEGIERFPERVERVIEILVDGERKGVRDAETAI